jgi:hypothetical protein
MGYTTRFKGTFEGERGELGALEFIAAAAEQALEVES